MLVGRRHQLGAVDRLERGRAAAHAAGEPLPFAQKDIGINLRSTPATYLNISDTIRKLFGEANKVSIQLFSFNSKGACPACGGKGIIVSDMAFMESIETVCDVCHGTRYNDEVLQYRYQGKNIAEVMDLSVEGPLTSSMGNLFNRNWKRWSKSD